MKCLKRKVREKYIDESKKWTLVKSVLVVLKSCIAIFRTTNNKKHAAMVEGKPKNLAVELQCTLYSQRWQKNNIFLKVVFFLSKQWYLLEYTRKLYYFIVLVVVVVVYSSTYLYYYLRSFLCLGSSILIPKIPSSYSITSFQTGINM